MMTWWKSFPTKRSWGRTTSRSERARVRGSGGGRGVPAGLLTVVLFLAAAALQPLAAQEDAGEREDPFAGWSIFDRSPDLEVVVGELAVEEAVPPAHVSSSDFYRAGMLVRGFHRGWIPHGVTAGVIRENPLGLTFEGSLRLRDRVKLYTGDLEVSEGDVLQAIRVGRSVAPHGHILHSKGMVEVTRVEGDSARAVVIRLFGDFQEGDPVIEAEPFRTLSLTQLERAEVAVTGHVVALEARQVLVGNSGTLFLDVGSRDGVRVGDEFAVYSRGVRDAEVALEEDRLGTLRVIRTTRGTSTTRPVDVRDVGIGVGSPVKLIRRLPVPGG